MKKLLIIAICLFGLSPFLKAQMLNLNYQISLPMNQVKDFTDKASFRGFDIEYHQFLGDQFSIGAAIGWDVFYKDKKHTPGNFRFNGNSNVSVSYTHLDVYKRQWLYYALCMLLSSR